MNCGEGKGKVRVISREIETIGLSLLSPFSLFRFCSGLIGWPLFPATFLLQPTLPPLPTPSPISFFILFIFFY